MAQGVYNYDYDRTTYQHRYYTRNKHRKAYTYVKKGVMKKVSPKQYELLQLLRKGFIMHSYTEKYRYFKGGKYHEVYVPTVEALIRSGHLEHTNEFITLTPKGRQHRQNEKI